MYVVRSISGKFSERLNDGQIHGVHVYGTTKLRNEIYVLCRCHAPVSHMIYVFEDRNPFRLRKKIEINQIKSPEDIVSSEKENCLYVSDSAKRYVWKVTREIHSQISILLGIDHMPGTTEHYYRPLTTDYYPPTLSVSSNNQLLVFSQSSPFLMMYNLDGKLTRRIELPRYMEHPLHAVETSKGNIFIVHRWIKTKEESVSNWKEWVLSELGRDGQIIRHFIPSNTTQWLTNPCYLALDSDDRLFVADKGNGRVVLFDSDLEWNRIICPTKRETERKCATIREPWRLCYDKKEKQLIVGGDFCLGEAVNVYTVN